MNADEQEAFAAYGLAFGLIVPVLDDLTDLLSAERVRTRSMLKSLGSGIFPLPAVLAAQRLGLGDAEYRSFTDLATDHRLICEHGIAPAIHLVFQWARQASAALDTLPPSAARDALQELPARHAMDLLVERTAPAFRPLLDTAISEGAVNGPSE